MADGNRLYPFIEPDELKSPPFSEAIASPRVSDRSQGASFNLEEEENKEEITSPVNDEFTTLQTSQTEENNTTNLTESFRDKKQGKYFYYDSPLLEDTGIWIPVSVPPLSESDHQEWSRGFSTNGAYFPEGEISWDQLIEENKEMTMWDVFSEMLLAARGKVSSLTNGELTRGTISFISTHVLEQAWNDMANTLTEANFGNAKEILDTEPPKSIVPLLHACFAVSGSIQSCVLGIIVGFVVGSFVGNVREGGAYCRQSFVLETQNGTLRSWLNFPWGQSMEYEIYKAANIIRGYNKVGSLRPEKPIPDAILKQAKGLAILTVAKVGLMVTYNVGTGLVIARRDDGSWSAPSAISSFGLGWGAQAGGEFTDFIIVLRTKDAIKTFSGNAHISVGAGVSAAAGIVGRAAEADLRAGDGGYAACYTYSCSKGAFVGCSLQGNMVTTRAAENCRFYGSSSIKASDILLGSVPKAPAAAILYQALSDLFQRVQK
ncbi:uncharacterized protein A4U43_UnF4390 [Asparagus officinalis]|uniref:Ysc84 actin-binding domain-containing protein n=1 Tax=Asparagus officinalis TaxID=4686 RepID=A0A1R3L6Y6_ASPOF|nr:uncharacterized protein A4U43_UnF4390 [Asparagus officinalis]